MKVDNKSKISVSVVLAGYNESANINRAMTEIYDALKNNFETYELILVDDASKDDTYLRMEEFTNKHDNVRFLPNYVNLNFGASVLRGLFAAKNDYVIFNACDLPLSTDDMVKRLCSLTGDTDVVVLERTEYKTTRWRGITSNINRMFLKLLYPNLTKGTPVLNYAQIYRRGIVKEIVPFARSPIFVWPELVFRAKIKGYNIENIKVKCNVENLRKGSFGHPHDIIWGVYEMLRFRIRLWNKSI